MSDIDKIKACFLLGACGDALGAPVEMMRDQKEIFKRFGPGGVREIVEYQNPFEPEINYPAGRLTDDTTMAMTTAAAVLLAAKRKDFRQALKDYAWQAYLNWGRYQDNALEISEKIDLDLAWPRRAQEFWFACGAGRGTIAALRQPLPGAIDRPLNYSEVVRDTEVIGPNDGCGGMMRIAPVAFASKLDSHGIFEAACENAALTHGHQEAFVAAGVIALFVHFAARDYRLSSVLEETLRVLHDYEQNSLYEQGVEACVNAICQAWHKAMIYPDDVEAIDVLPAELGFKSAFKAIPVLAQATYAISCATPSMSKESIKDLMSIAVSHSGDSDSVGAIVGQVLGARYGLAVLPDSWIEILTQRDAIEEMAEALFRAYYSPQAESSYSRQPKP